MPFAKPPKLDDIEQAPGLDEAVADIGAPASTLVSKTKTKPKTNAKTNT